MKNLYKNVDWLDKRVVDEFQLSEELLMENAASALEFVIDSKASSNSMIIIVVGVGNNGADGLALARRIIGKYNVKIFMPNEPKSELGKLQLERVRRMNAEFIEKLQYCDIVVDCLFGSGFSGNLSLEASEWIEKMNDIARLKIACDTPSGLTMNGRVTSPCLKADITLSMGALKLAYFSDEAKDFVGEIKVANLGISSINYEQDSSFKLLERSDMELPRRVDSNVHKGSFGHCCVIAGEKEGACVLSAMSAFAFGSGLVSIIGEVKNLPYHIMKTHSLPHNCSAVAFGMGLGEQITRYSFEFIGKIPSVIDADMFYFNGLSSMLHSGNLVLTPHIKEFASLLKMTGIGEFSIEYILANRITLALDFSLKYPNIVLLLKGANVIIAQNGRIYINPFGNNNLAKGGSGDVLSGMIAGLLAQGYSLLKASITASLAHSFASNEIKSEWGLEPMDLIENIKKLKGE